MTNKKIAGMALCGALVSGLAAFGEELTVPRSTGASLTAAASYSKMTVNGPLSVSGGGQVIAITNTGATVIGPDVGDDASVSISGGAYLIVQGGSNVTYGANGGLGGKISVSGDTSFAEGWGSRSGEGMRGTFGGKSVHRISSQLTSSSGVFDLVEMGSKGYFGFEQIATENTAVKTRLLFNGGVVWVYTYYGGTLFNVAAHSEIILEGVDSNTIAFHGLCGQMTPIRPQTFMTGEGRVTVKGKGALEYRMSNSPEPTTLSLGGDINWENDGGFIISGGGHFIVKTTQDNVLPYEKGGVTVQSGRGGVDEKYGLLWNALDLNGTTQRIHSLTLGTYAHVTNSSATRALLEIGACATNKLSLSGVIGGPIDVLIKSSLAEMHATNALVLVGGARLLTPVFADATFGNLRSDGGVYSGTLTVSNWNFNISSNPSYVKAGARRDLPISLLKGVDLEPDATVDILNGALAVARFAGAEGAFLHVRSNAAFRVQSQGGFHYKYIRFVFKETIGASKYAADKKLYPCLRALCLTDDTGANYWPVNQGFTCQSAETALDDMPAGSYKFSSDKAACGNGKDLDLVNVPNNDPSSSLRSTDYNFNREKLFSSAHDWGGFLMTNSVPRRADASSWHVITLRLKDDDTKISGYWFGANWCTSHNPGCWAVEASADGTTWVTLDEKTDYYPFSNSNPPSSAGNEGYMTFNAIKTFGEAFPFLWTTNILSGSVSLALNGMKVRVDRGGTLDVAQTGAPAEIGWLEVDARTGAGYLSGFKPLPNGVLNLVNVRTPGALGAGEHRFALTCGSIVNPENLATWKVYADGIEVPHARIELTNGGIKITGFGTVLIVL